MPNKYLDIILEIKRLYCLLGVYVDFLLSKLGRTLTLNNIDPDYVRMEKKALELKTCVKMIEEKLHEELVMLDENVLDYVDCVTVIEFTNELLQTIDSFLEFLGMITRESSIQ